MRPGWFSESNTDLRLDGSNSQHIGNQFDPFRAGVSQDVSVTPGTTYTFKTFARGRISNDTYPAPSFTFKKMNARVGIDPNGGGVWTSPSIVWSSPVAPHDAWLPMEVQVTAASSTITVFIEGDFIQIDNCAAHIDIWFDSASLTAIGTPVNTAVPTNTPPPAVTNPPPASTATPFRPTATPGTWPTNTPFIPTATPSSFATNTPFVPTNTPVRITNTPWPTRTPLPTSTPWPTRTPFPTNTPLPSPTPLPTGPWFTATPTPVPVLPTSSPVATSAPVVAQPTAVIIAATNTPLPVPTATLEPTAETTGSENAQTEPTGESSEPTTVSEAAPTAPLAPTGGTICINTFSDDNANGVRDELEGYMAGIAVMIGQNNTVQERGTTTGTSDPICFDGLTAGEYEVAQRIPNSLELTTTGSLTLDVQEDQTIGIEFGSRFKEAPTSEDLAATEQAIADAQAASEQPTVATDTAPTSSTSTSTSTSTSGSASSETNDSIATTNPTNGFNLSSFIGIAVLALAVILLGIILIVLLRRG